jgi:phosphoadenosine phosphosulfate reductase
MHTTDRPFAAETPAGRAERLNAALREAPATEVLRKVITEDFPGRIAVVSSFGAEAAVLLALVADVDPATPVIFLDTRRHFPETARYRDSLVERLGLLDVRVRRPSPKEVAAEDPKDDPRGPLSSRDADACCALRKTRPLKRALEGFDAWITGRKRFQSATRLNLSVVETDADGRIKVNPLANWSQEDVDAFLAARGLPKHPLVAEGYASIGCEPCTSRTAPGEEGRAGRWRGLDKTECGIHFTPDGRMVRSNVADAT